MSKQRKIKPLLVVVVLLQALFLLTMAGSYHLAHAWGEEIRLKTMPVDPRDLFYGDYVTLGYEISTIPIDLIDDLDASGDFHISDLEGKRIYVLLTEEYGLYRVERAYLDRRNVPKDSWPVLRGQIRAGWNDETRIDYGLERDSRTGRHRKRTGEKTRSYRDADQNCPVGTSAHRRSRTLSRFCRSLVKCCSVLYD